MTRQLFLWRALAQTALLLDLPDPFPRMTYADAMERYGSDKPDIRYGMELINFKPFSDKSDFNAFTFDFDETTDLAKTC